MTVVGGAHASINAPAGIAIGSGVGDVGAFCDGAATIAIGNAASALGPTSISIGSADMNNDKRTLAEGVRSIVIGSNASCEEFADYSVCIGSADDGDESSFVRPAKTLCIGHKTSVPRSEEPGDDNSNCILIGRGATISSSDSSAGTVLLGRGARSRKTALNQFAKFAVGGPGANADQTVTAGAPLTAGMVGWAVRINNRNFYIPVIPE